MNAMASQITSLMIVYWIVYSVTDQRKHQNSASPDFVRGIHRWPVNSPHKGPVTRKMFPFDDVIMCVLIGIHQHHISLMWCWIHWCTWCLLDWYRLRKYRTYLKFTQICLLDVFHVLKNVESSKLKSVWLLWWLFFTFIYMFYYLFLYLP